MRKTLKSQPFAPLQPKLHRSSLALLLDPTIQPLRNVMSPNEQPRGDPIITDLLPNSYIEWLTNNADKVNEISEDMPSLTALIQVLWFIELRALIPGREVPAKVHAVLKKISRHMVLITYKNIYYVDSIGLSYLPSIATYNGAVLTIDGKSSCHNNDKAKAERFAREMVEFLGEKKGASITFDNISCSVSFSSEINPQLKDDIEQIMQAQSEASMFKFQGDDKVYTLRAQGNRRVALADFLSLQSNSQAIACGVDPKVDGSMLIATGGSALSGRSKGIMVKNRFLGFPVVNSPEDLIVILEWYSNIINKDCGECDD